jgi:hypothetical protein
MVAQLSPDPRAKGLKLSTEGRAALDMQGDRVYRWRGATEAEFRPAWKGPSQAQNAHQNGGCGSDLSQPSFQDIGESLMGSYKGPAH